MAGAADNTTAHPLGTVARVDWCDARISQEVTRLDAAAD
jgi:hypothetical protein